MSDRGQEEGAAESRELPVPSSHGHFQVAEVRAGRFHQNPHTARRWQSLSGLGVGGVVIFFMCRFFFFFY